MLAFVAAEPPNFAEVWIMGSDQHWPDSNVTALRGVAMRLGVDPRDLVAVMCHESDCLPDPPHHGPARGLIQFEPQTLKNLGWHGSPDDFSAQNDVASQLVYVERYFRSYANQGLLDGKGLGGLYVATFLPALLKNAGDLNYHLCGALGPLDWAYKANRGFDKDRKGFITVGDLLNAARASVAVSTRARVILAEIDAQEALPAAPITKPEIDDADASNDNGAE